MSPTYRLELTEHRNHYSTLAVNQTVPQPSRYLSRASTVRTTILSSLQEEVVIMEVDMAALYFTFNELSHGLQMDKGLLRVDPAS